MKIALILISIEPYTDWNKLCQFLVKVIIVNSAILQSVLNKAISLTMICSEEIKRNTAQAQQPFRVQYCKFALAYTRISACACIGKENVMHDTTVM